MKWLQRYAEGPADAKSEPGEQCVSPPALQTCAALKALHQAAQLIRTIQARATEAETQARASVLQAIEDIKAAEARVISIEEQSDFAVAALEEADSRAQEIEEALREEESQLADYEVRLTNAELRVRLAEGLANDTEKTLTCVEAAIRIHLTEQRPNTPLNLAKAA